MKGLSAAEFHRILHDPTVEEMRESHAVLYQRMMSLPWLRVCAEFADAASEADPEGVRPDFPIQCLEQLLAAYDDLGAEVADLAYRLYLYERGKCGAQVLVPPDGGDESPCILPAGHEGAHESVDTLIYTLAAWKRRTDAAEQRCFQLHAAMEEAVERVAEISPESEHGNAQDWEDIAKWRGVLAGARGGGADS